MPTGTVCTTLADKYIEMNKRTERFYNQFAFFYPLADLFLRSQKKVLFREVNHLPDGHVLEIGVGNGAHLKLYQRHRITGIDTSLAMLESARKNQRPDMELLQMNGEALEFEDNSFDYVVLSHVLAVVDEPEQVMEEVQRVLKPGGRVFILNHFTPDNWLRHIDHAFGRIARLFRFRSVFHIRDLSAIGKFTLLKEIPLGSAAYFRLLIYGKK